MHLCCQNGHNETCRVLLLAGCKPDIKNNVISFSKYLEKSLCALTQKRSSNWYILFFFQYGDTPLHTGARYGHAGVIRILVSADCNPSEQNKVINFSWREKGYDLELFSLLK